MELFDEKKLKLFIEEKFKVSSQRIPFYVYWIKMFNNNTSDLNSADNIQDKFINSLNSRYPEWQVKQADKAVTIFLSFIRKNDKSSPKSRIKDNTDWKYVLFNMKEELRLQNKSLQTEKSYIYWVKKISNYSSYKEPERVNQDDVKAFLTYLVVEKSVAISTHKQAFNAILFLFRHILDKQILNLDSVARSKVKKRLPLVLSRIEIFEIIKLLKNPYKLMAEVIRMS